MEPGQAGDYQTVVQLSDGVSAVCLVAQKAFQPYAGTTSFDDNMKAQGFFPGLSIAQNVLEDTIFEISMKAMSPAEMAEKIKVATEEFGQAVQAMTAALPAEVFKLEDIVRKGSTTGGPAPGEDPTTGNGDRGEPAGDLLSNEQGSKSSIEPMSSVQKTANDDSRTGADNGLDGEGDEGTGADDLTAGEAKKQMGAKKKGPGKKKDGDSDEDVAKEDEDPMATVKELIAALGTQLTEGLAGVQKQVSDIESRVSAAESVATKAEEATRGRVSATAPEDDGLVTTSKSDDFAAAGPLLDTAFQSVVD